VRKADNILPSSADVTEFGSLNLPEPPGPHRPVMGMLYLYQSFPGQTASNGPTVVGSFLWGDSVRKDSALVFRVRCGLESP
jgi:hypothetical protein